MFTAGPAQIFQGIIWWFTQKPKPPTVDHWSGLNGPTTDFFCAEEFIRIQPILYFVTIQIMKFKTEQKKQQPHSSQENLLLKHSSRRLLTNSSWKLNIRWVLESYKTPRHVCWSRRWSTGSFSHNLCQICKVTLFLELKEIFCWLNRSNAGETQFWMCDSADEAQSHWAHPVFSFISLLLAACFCCDESWYNDNSVFL